MSPKARKRFEHLPLDVQQTILRLRDTAPDPDEPRRGPGRPARKLEANTLNLSGKPGRKHAA